jgi:hypothetical protein
MWLYIFKSQFVSVTKKVVTKGSVIIKGVCVVSSLATNVKTSYIFKKILILNANVMRIKEVEDHKLNHKWGEKLQQYLKANVVEQKLILQNKKNIFKNLNTV